MLARAGKILFDNQDGMLELIRLPPCRGECGQPMLFLDVTGFKALVFCWRCLMLNKLCNVIFYIFFKLHSHVFCVYDVGGIYLTSMSDM